MTRVVAKSGQKDLVVTSAQPGVLYVSGLPVEKNFFAGLRRKLTTIAQAFETIHGGGGGGSAGSGSPSSCSAPSSSAGSSPAPSRSRAACRRADTRRVGLACVRTGGSRWVPSP